jgi:3-oxoacyl-[acyl-carrier protein] reductase
MNLGLTDKVAFVAGASSGLGKATALELAREGARVAISARGEEALNEAAREIEAETGGEVLPVVADVTDEEQVRQAIARTVEHFGALHILIANAGGARGGTFGDLDNADFKKGWELNFLSNVNLIRAALPHLRDAGWGRIITITSVSVKQPIDDLLLSNTVRPGVVGLVRSLATELAPEGITVNNVGPGYTRTARVESLLEARSEKEGRAAEEISQEIISAIPMRRMGEPEEQAAVITFLASERASFVTGQTILVDGGRYRGLM